MCADGIFNLVGNGVKPGFKFEGDDLVTEGGAKLMGLDGVGTLQVGQAADIALYDLDDPRHFGLHDPAVGPVASGGRAKLRALLVQGRTVVENDLIPGLDLGALRRDAQRLVNTMLS